MVFLWSSAFSGQGVPVSSVSFVLLFGWWEFWNARGARIDVKHANLVIWALVASFIIIALPIWESKDQILAVFDGIFHTNLCEYYNPETSKQHKLHTAAAAAEPAKAAEPAS